MSTALEKRTYSQALQDAEAFKSLFPIACFQRWEFAGSLRRRTADVGDIEHVCIPNYGEVDTGAGLFAMPERVSLLWLHLDSLVRGGTVEKHWYGGTGNRWGTKYRGVDFRGFNHEIFTVEPGSFGSQLLIRTGPAEYSRRMVTGLLRHGRRHYEGRVWKCRPCPLLPHYATSDCQRCQGTGLEPMEPIDTPNERTCCELAGIAYVEPEQRT